MEVWNEEQRRQEISGVDAARIGDTPLSVTLYPGQRIASVRGGRTTPQMLLCDNCPELIPSTIVARVNGTLWDLTRPIPDAEMDSRTNAVEFLGFDTCDAARDVFWHSSAHVLGQALELRFPGTLLCDGPATSEGFFYEAFLEEGRTLSPEDVRVLQAETDRIIQARQPFERMVVSRDVARKIFAYNRFKHAILDALPEKDTITLYRCGNLIDLCRGPHVVNTGVLKWIRLRHASGAFLAGDSSCASLQRVYGISFPTREHLEQYERKRSEMAKRDHRIIGKNQGLFMIHKASPGNVFFLPHGTRIYNRLIDFLRHEYRKRGYDEVVTPLLFDKSLWERSGHWENYRTNMFLVGGSQESLDHDQAKQEEQKMFGLKPMNCPGHCLIFASKSRSYRDLPLRLADFSALHRNEPSGTLSGLTRVRRFCQDDAHIFCSEEQVEVEIRDCLDFVRHVYGIFGFEFHVTLSTRPTDFMGTPELWNRAEAALRDSVERFGHAWELNEGDGAFYGPKIDISVTDALGRRHQCATIQLDFQLPRRFDLQYTGPDGHDYAPVIIHRAILGSIERMLAILIEHTGGKWPFWLSPRQVMVIPVASAFNTYANTVAQRLSEFFVDVNVSHDTLNRKIREAQVQQYNLILVVGEREVREKGVTVRTRDGRVHGLQKVEQVLDDLRLMVQEFR